LLPFSISKLECTRGRSEQGCDFCEEERSSVCPTEAALTLANARVSIMNKKNEIFFFLTTAKLLKIGMATSKVVKPWFQYFFFVAVLSEVKSARLLFLIGKANVTDTLEAAIA